MDDIGIIRERIAIRNIPGYFGHPPEARILVARKVAEELLYDSLVFASIIHAKMSCNPVVDSERQALADACGALWSDSLSELCRLSGAIGLDDPTEKTKDLAIAYTHVCAVANIKVPRSPLEYRAAYYQWEDHLFEDLLAVGVGDGFKKAHDLLQMTQRGSFLRDAVCDGITEQAEDLSPEKLLARRVDDEPNGYQQALLALEEVYAAVSETPDGPKGNEAVYRKKSLALWKDCMDALVEQEPNIINERCAIVAAERAAERFAATDLLGIIARQKLALLRAPSQAPAKQIMHHSL